MGGGDKVTEALDFDVFKSGRGALFLWNGFQLQNLHCPPGFSFDSRLMGEIRSFATSFPARDWEGTFRVLDFSLSNFETTGYLLLAFLLDEKKILLFLRSFSFQLEVDYESLEKKWGLTRRERELAALVLEGLSTEDMAARLEVSSHTIATHLRNIYAKTETSCQIELQHRILECFSPISSGLARE